MNVFEALKMLGAMKKMFNVRIVSLGMRAELC